MNIRIRGGRVIDPGNGRDAVMDVYIAGGKVLAAGAAGANFTAEREIDAAGQVVCPGFVDLSARLREPGEEHAATIASETRAAAVNGITTLCCPPDTKPVIDTPAVVELIHQRAEQSGFAKVVCLGALTHGLAAERLADMYALKAAGCVGVSNALKAVVNTEIMLRAMQYAATCDLTVFIFPEDHWLGRRGYMHEGAHSTRLGIPGIPETAETIALMRDLLLVEQTGVRAHFCRLSTARSAAMIAAAKGKGLPVSADVSAHQLHLTSVAVGFFNSMCHVRPPLRGQDDMEGLRAAVANGVIDAICSDHQPLDRDAKTAPFNATEPGMSALDTLLPLVLRLFEAGSLGISQAIAAVTVNAARILGIDAGTLTPGRAADICIFDPGKRWRFCEDGMASAGKNTPFRDWEFSGRVTHTLIDGRIVFQV